MRYHSSKAAGACKVFWGFITVFIFGCDAINQGNYDDSWLGEAAQKEWRFYLGDHASQQYSVLDQINTSNVQQLEVAWTYRSNDGKPAFGEIQCNPIVVNGLLYGSTPEAKIFALNAGTGEEIWTFDPQKIDKRDRQGRHRGVMYWQDRDDKRLIFTSGPHLYALNALTGEIIYTFGDSGRVSLHEGLDRDVTGLAVDSATPGVIYKNLLILGSRVAEGNAAAPGHIRAYDVRTGKREWIFHTIPHPGEFGYDAWPPDAWKKRGGANNWSGMTLDRERGIVFIPTGSPSFDFYGGNRKGANLFGNSVIALNAATGERIWHYQTVRHDVWDRDIPAPPNLVTIKRDGKKIEALAQITKSGHVFIFDRETGEPLFPIEEKEYPASDLEGEETWTTQPLPTKPPPFARQIFREQDVTDISPESHEFALNRFREVRSNGQFIPPSREGTMIFPGFDGGGEWGGAAYDPESGIMYVNSNEMPWILTMVPVKPTTAKAGSALGKNLYMTQCAVCHGPDLKGDAAKVYPGLLGLKERSPRDSIMHIIENGRGVMLPFKFISEKGRNAITDYILTEGKEDDDADSEPQELPEIAYVSTGYHRFVDPDGYPAIKPPWGTLNAIDLNKGEIVWQVPLGEFEELTKKGIPQTGTENYGGPVVTAGGLIFIAASKDEKFRAFDKNTGEVLWETKLPFGGYATPATYEYDGRQYVVIACGGGKMGTKPGDAYVAFALPE